MTHCQLSRSEVAPPIYLEYPAKQAILRASVDADAP